MKKIIVAPDSFKGSLSSKKACDIMAKALEETGRFEAVKMPLADGGEGTADIAASLDGSRIKSVEVVNPLGKKVSAEYVINGKTAIIESAKACGLTLLSTDERNPLFTTTYGVGQLVSDALSEDIDSIAITLGGSSTNDCGAGFLSALGAEFTGVGLHRFMCGKDLCEIEDINLDGLDKRLKNIRITAVCDVENPLYGKNGAAYVFAPQKGADEKTVEILDEGLRRFSDIIKKKTCTDIA
ncbi:MAG: glycerate kinase, partial [Clostridia bacterium]|nr:glycerate kinase [Clostridia bacterium]